MIFEMLKLIRDFLFIDVPNSDKKEFNASINKISVPRAKITTVTFIILGIILLVTSIAVKRENFLKTPNIYYGIMYVILIFVMIIYLIIFDRLERNLFQRGKYTLFFGSSFAFVILVWCAGISLLDLLSDGQIIIYILAIISIAVTPLFRPISLFKIYLSVHIIFLVLLPFFQSGGYLFGSYVNSTTVLIISWVISCMRFKNRVEDFDNKKKVLEKSKELKNVNIKLEETNKKLEEANRKLEILSRTDSLTGVYNRSVFNQILNLEWNSCKNDQMPLSLIMADIDFFKAYNDNYGHVAGDDCLILVANTLSMCAKRYTDNVIRYGGEEFTIILTHIEKERALELAEEMRRKVEELKIIHDASSISKYLTISLGVYTVIPSDQLTLDDFIRRADKALYKAKSEERNKVVVT